MRVLSCATDKMSYIFSYRISNERWRLSTGCNRRQKQSVKQHVHRYGCLKTKCFSFVWSYTYTLIIHFKMNFTTLDNKIICYSFSQNNLNFFVSILFRSTEYNFILCCCIWGHFASSSLRCHIKVNTGVVYHINYRHDPPSFQKCQKNYSLLYEGNIYCFNI